MLGGLERPSIGGGEGGPCIGAYWFSNFSLCSPVIPVRALVRLLLLWSCRSGKWGIPFTLLISQRHLPRFSDSLRSTHTSFSDLTAFGHNVHNMNCLLSAVQCPTQTHLPHFEDQITLAWHFPKKSESLNKWHPKRRITRVWASNSVIPAFTSARGAMQLRILTRGSVFAGSGVGHWQETARSCLHKQELLSRGVSTCVPTWKSPL